MYYLRQRTRVSGPFTTDQVKAMLHRGRIARSDKVSLDRETWQSIGETPELIERPQPVEIVPVEPAPVTDARLWYFTLAGVQQQAAVDTATLAQFVSSGQVGPGERIWTEGFTDWQPIAMIPEFAAATGPSAAPGFPRPDAFPPPQAADLFDVPLDLPPVTRKKRGWL